jgi:hypothetical protein
MKRALRMGIASLAVAGGLALAAAPAGATVVCGPDGCTGGDTARAGTANAVERSGNAKVGATSAFLAGKLLPPNPVAPTDPNSPGFGVLTAFGLAPA